MVLVAGGTSVDETAIKMREPFGVGFDAVGHLFVIEMAAGNRLLQLGTEGAVRVVAGTGEAGDSGDGGPARAARFNGPHNLAVLPGGDVLIADTWNGRIRRYHTRAQTVSTLPGWGVPAWEGKAAGPYCITLDAAGTRLYVSDLRRVHAVDVASGRSVVAAGNGEKGIPLDDAVAVEAPLVDPRAAASDRAGRLYILERGGHALRVVDSTGRVRTVVNRSGQPGTITAAMPALEARLRGPKHLCVDRDDSVLIADAENHRVVRYRPASGQLEPFAGTGVLGAAGLGGDPRSGQLARPHGVAVHPQTGEVYIADSYNDRILKVVP
jgi:DNA-binding beta-propeller fold protein YncE